MAGWLSLFGRGESSLITLDLASRPIITLVSIMVPTACLVVLHDDIHLDVALKLAAEGSKACNRKLEVLNGLVIEYRVVR